MSSIKAWIFRGSPRHQKGSLRSRGSAFENLCSIVCFNRSVAKVLPMLRLRIHSLLDITNHLRRYGSNWSLCCLVTLIASWGTHFCIVLRIVGKDLSPIERSIVNREVMNDASLCILPGNPDHKWRHTLAMLRDITSMFREAYMETAYLGIIVVNCNLQRLLCGWYGLEHGEGIDCWYGSHGWMHE